jgi:hypothetical protein
MHITEAGKVPVASSTEWEGPATFKPIIRAFDPLVVMIISFTFLIFSAPLPMPCQALSFHKSMDQLLLSLGYYYIYSCSALGSASSDMPLIVRNCGHGIRRLAGRYCLHKDLAAPLS